jgi:hypothetical protein
MIIKPEDIIGNSAVVINPSHDKFGEIGIITDTNTEHGITVARVELKGITGASYFSLGNNLRELPGIIAVPQDCEDIWVTNLAGKRCYLSLIQTNLANESNTEAMEIYRNRFMALVHKTNEDENVVLNFKSINATKNALNLLRLKNALRCGQRTLNYQLAISILRE